MPRTTNARGQALAVAAVAIAALAIIAAIAFTTGTAYGDPPAPSPTPVQAPTPLPSAGPSDPTDPSAGPSVAPSAPSDGSTTVDLDIATDHDVSVVVKDRTGSVRDVVSGQAGDGMSVRWFDVKVENIDAETIRVTWVGLPVDEVIDLTISTAGDKVALDFVQDGPPANSDALGFDRVLVIEFDAAVDASDVEVSFPKPLPA